MKEPPHHQLSVISTHNDDRALLSLRPRAHKLTRLHPEQKAEEPAPWSPDEAIVRSKFNHYDTDNSGDLDENEVMALAQVCVCISVCESNRDPQIVFSGRERERSTKMVCVFMFMFVCACIAAVHVCLHVCANVCPDVCVVSGFVDGFPPQGKTARFYPCEGTYQGPYARESGETRARKTAREQVQAREKDRERARASESMRESTCVCVFAWY